MGTELIVKQFLVTNPRWIAEQSGQSGGDQRHGDGAECLREPGSSSNVKATARTKDGKSKKAKNAKKG